ncbi:YqhG family protein [Virgibacillus sp. C22-A2]|uniref:YqhG family protein n=1 Tax=Virgibacillus tibetensis TaxID=3042313 RepID=A0ABU6KAY7_9BACI|nr:YqhG family protein [Virgibacillus sp. C22-A2]
MAITNLESFLQTYFKAHHCTFINKDEGLLTVQLTEEMDKALMNRPFYWHYINNMGRSGDPMQLTLITNPDKRGEKGEWIHFGSPRLQQIIKHLKENQKYTKLFQLVDAKKNTALYPWLVTNIKVSYRGKHKRDELISIGLHLVNGTMKVEMMGLLNKIPLQKTISDYCYTISPIIKLSSGYRRIEKVIDNYIENQTHDWAEESMQIMDNEIHMLKHFYEGQVDTEEEQMKKEIFEITDRYRPSITYEVINGGIFYLTSTM